MVGRINTPIAKVVTKDGECHVTITLELNINLTGESSIAGISAQSASIKKEEPEEVNWAIPDFGASPKISFGKKTGDE